MARLTRGNFNSGAWVSGGEVYPGGGEAEPKMQEEMMQEDMQESPQQQGEKKRPPWHKVGPDGKPIKRKPNPKKRNAILRKALHPKSAIMCLNELQSGLVYDVEALAPVGNYAASVEVNGQLYRGFGTTKSLAKQAAAEAALVSFVKPPPPKPLPGQNRNDIEDETPWKSIASFAMYKLFSEWSEGRVGNNHMNMMGQGQFHQAPVTDLRGYLNAPPMNADDNVPNANITMHLGNQMQPMNSAAGGATISQAAKPAKGLTEETKRTQHPVMVLHQLMPTVKYDSCEEFEGNTKSYTLSTYVGTTPYAGSGSSMKKAKFALAKLILKEAYGIDNEYEQSK